MSRLLTAEEVALWINVKLPTLRKWTSQGTIPSIKLSSRAVRYSEAAIAEWIQSKACPKKEEAPTDSNNRRKEIYKNAAGGDVDRIIARVKREVLRK